MAASDRPPTRGTECVGSSRCWAQRVAMTAQSDLSSPMKTFSIETSHCRYRPDVSSSFSRRSAKGAGPRSGLAWRMADRRLPQASGQRTATRSVITGREAPADQKGPTARPATAILSRELQVRNVIGAVRLPRAASLRAARRGCLHGLPAVFVERGCAVSRAAARPGSAGVSAFPHTPRAGLVRQADG